MRSENIEKFARPGVVLLGALFAVCVDCIAIASEPLAADLFGTGPIPEGKPDPALLIPALIGIPVVIFLLEWLRKSLPESLLSQRPGGFLRGVLQLRSPGWRYELRVVLGVATLVFFLGIFVHWTAVVIYGLCSARLQSFGWRGNLVPLGVILFALVIGWLAVFVFRIIRKPELRVNDWNAPGAFGGLILFLSNPLPPPEKAKPSDWDDFRKLISSFSLSLTGEGADEVARTYFGRSNWLMPVLSIWHQLKQSAEQRIPLTNVVIIVSSDSDTSHGPPHGQSGTFRMADFFVKRLREWCGEAAPIFTIWPPEGKGVDFFDPDRIIQAVEGAYEFMREHHIQGTILDLTGGTAQCSLVAGALSFEVGRVYKYISTRDTKIQRAYDMFYESAGDHPETG